MNSQLKQLRKQLALTQRELAEILSCSSANIAMIETGKSALSQKNRKILVKKFNINPDWFDNKNVPFRDAALSHAVAVSQQPRSVPASVPLFDIEKIPNLADLLRFTAQKHGKIGQRRTRRGRMTVEERNFAPQGWIAVPGLPDCDGALRISGDSMSPVVGGGSVVIYSKLDSPAEIVFGEMYLISIATSAGEYVALRYIRKPGSKAAKHNFFKAATAYKSDDYDDKVVLSAANPNFPDIEIEPSKIRALALVKAAINVFSTK